MQREEIPSAEIDRYASGLLRALDAICESPAFRTSPRSCEFLRHIVRHTVQDNVDELKERLIGITLLGRETTYDTGSDAGVRVRANDVRKRLNAYNASTNGDAEFTIELPVGSYIPRLFRSVPPLEPAAITTASAAGLGFDRSSEQSELDSVPPLSMRQLIAPTLVALFLCMIFIRWQLAQEHPFVTFWQTVLEDHEAVLCLPPFPTAGQQAISLASMNETAQLLNLAGQFHAHLTLTDGAAPSRSPAEIVISLGPSTSPSPATPSRDRFVMQNTSGLRTIVDRKGPAPRVLSGRAALLTITNGPQRSIQIDGTDDAAIAALIQTLTERMQFPEELADSLQRGTATQAVFPMMPHAQTIFAHANLSPASATTAQLP